MKCPYCSSFYTQSIKENTFICKDCEKIFYFTPPRESNLSNISNTNHNIPRLFCPICDSSNIVFIKEDLYVCRNCLHKIGNYDSDDVDEDDNEHRDELGEAMTGAIIRCYITVINAVAYFFINFVNMILEGMTGKKREE